MKIVLTQRRAFEGLTYQPGKYELDDVTAQSWLEKWPNVCHEWQPPKPKRTRSKKGESKVDESTADSAGLPET